MPLDGPMWLCPACLAANFFSSDGAEPLSMDEPVRAAGDMIGRYRLMEPIGEGGFGIVYRAEQTQPFQRQVALKLIKPGLDSRVVVARFETERQAMALLDHPNIARALDAGTTADGRPFFVMELVEGLPVNLFCAKHRLTLNERLQLFLDICAGMEHAHAKGVIHRDLKPSNVMVSTGQKGDLPKVTIIDFGIAKALWQELTPHTLYTHPRQMLGTPEYMSPEQALHGGLNIDTRADVYSLGALLYEMITGQPPLSGAQLAQTGLDEWVRVIREVSPVRPSRRLATLGAEAQELKLLTSRTENELDWVVLKALAKERERRYQTVRELAEDVRRFLGDEAVSARPPSLSYITRKYVRRHRGQVLAAAAVVVVLVVGSVVSLTMAMRAEVAEKKTRHAFSLSDTTAAHDKVASQKYGEAVALLCRALRLDPHNREAAFRLMTLMAEAPVGVMDCPSLQHFESIWQGRFLPPDGKQILTASVRDGILALWDWQPGKVNRVRSFVMPDAISAFAVSADGRWVASGSVAEKSCQARVWSVESGDLQGQPLMMLGEDNAVKGSPHQVVSMAFSPDAQLLYTSTSDKALRAWRWVDSTLAWEVRGTSVARCLAVSSDGERVAAGYDDTRLGLYEALNGQVIHEAPVQRNRVEGVMFSPDSKRVLIKGGDTFSAVLDAKTGQKHGNLEHYDRLYDVAVEPGGERVATGGQDGYVRLRNLKGVFIHAERMPDVVRSLAFSPDGRWLAAGTQEPQATVSLMDGQTGVPLGAPLQMHRVVTDLSFHPQAQKLLVTCHSETAAVMDIRSRRLLPQILQTGEPVMMGGFLPEDSGVFVLTNSGTLRRQDWAGHLSKPLVELGRKPSAFYQTTGRQPRLVIAAGVRMTTVNLVTWQVEKEGMAPGPVVELHATEDGQRLLALDASRESVSLISLASNKVGYSWESDQGSITALTMSRDGRIVVTGHPNGMLVFHDLVHEARWAVKSRSKAEVLSLTLNPDGTRLVSGSQDALLYLWDVKSRTEVPESLARTPRHADSSMAGGVKTLFAQDAQQFLSYNSRDLRVRSFSAQTGQHTAPYLTHTSPVTHVVQSPEGGLLLTAELDNRVSLWSLSRYLPASVGFQLNASVVSLDFSANGRKALAVEKTGEVSVWSLPPSEGLPLPECFLRFAEGFGRWRLTSENVLQVMSYQVFDEARREVLALPDDPTNPQIAWMKWLAADPDERAERPE
ncbi:Serine/threonine protein kinase [Prosthecobacter debontii]|uniref:Serine/threonine protein kinase n=2 Tax=Prosthecobacter debontii TaxID=48467 RepID=A0A1T4YYK1_9BACT|nr:Serine/threonine protein kinase [Prosthecobacter debontii]